MTDSVELTHALIVSVVNLAHGCARMALTRLANALMAKGLPSTCMPGSSSLRVAALSAVTNKTLASVASSAPRRPLPIVHRVGQSDLGDEQNNFCVRR